MTSSTEKNGVNTAKGDSVNDAIINENDDKVFSKESIEQDKYFMSKADRWTNVNGVPYSIGAGRINIRIPKQLILSIRAAQKQDDLKIINEKLVNFKIRFCYECFSLHSLKCVMCPTCDYSDKALHASVGSETIEANKVDSEPAEDKCPKCKSKRHFGAMCIDCGFIRIRGSQKPAEDKEVEG